MFQWFERLVDPFPDTPPATPPPGLLPFLWASTAGTRRYIAAMTLFTALIGGFFAKDDAAILRAIDTMGFIAEGGDRALIERHVKDAFARLLKLDLQAAGQVDRGFVERMSDAPLDKRAKRALMRSIAYPDGWYELERALTMLVGITATHAPQLDAMQVAFPHVARYMRTMR